MLPALAKVNLEPRNTRPSPTKARPPPPSASLSLSLSALSKTRRRIATKCALSPRQIDDETVSLFQKHDRLPVLSITRCKYGEPRSSANVIGIVLDGTQVTDTGLKLLSAYPKLTFVNVRNSRVTDAGVAELLKTFPKLRVLR